MGLPSDHEDVSTAVFSASPTVTTVEFSSLSNHSKEMGLNDELKELEASGGKDAEAPIIQKVTRSTKSDDEGCMANFHILFPSSEGGTCSAVHKGN